MERPSIYGLLDPATGEIRYIGKANRPSQRYAGHIRDARRRNTPVYCWIRSLEEAGKRPRLKVLVDGSDDWRRDERVLIASARSRGDRLLNIADGGDEPHCEYEIRRANAIALNDLLASTPNAYRLRELKRSLSVALKRGFVSEVTKARMRNAAQRYPSLFGAWAVV